MVNIKGRSGFVQQEQRGFLGQNAREQDPLPFSTREGEKIPVTKIDGIDVFSWDDLVAAGDGRFELELAIIVDPPRGDELIVIEEAIVHELPDSGVATTGFFGVGAERFREDVGVFDAAGRSVTEFGSFAKLAVINLWDFFAGGGVGNFVTDTFTYNTENINDASDANAIFTDVAFATHDRTASDAIQLGRSNPPAIPASVGATLIASLTAVAVGSDGRVGHGIAVDGSNAENVQFDNAVHFTINGVRYYRDVDAE
ncbi:MAG: hypothetical protein IIC82_02890, partial [Chloroflexi bacterium]|nr:hypothetical protein [Chloroflexota bacterium]